MMNSQILKSVQILDQFGIKYALSNIPSWVHTVSDVVKVCHCQVDEVLKSILFVGTKPYLVLVTGDKKVDVERLRIAFSDGTIRQATSNEVMQITGTEAGTVSPFGSQQLVSIADNLVKTKKMLIMGSGSKDTLIRLKVSEFQKAFTGSYGDISC